VSEADRPMNSSLFAQRMRRVRSSTIMELIKATAAGDVISFASGLPDPSVFPQETLRTIADDVITRDGRAALQYGAAEGYAPLRASVAEMLTRRGLEVTPDQVLITTGSQQALDLVARALLDPQDRVVIENPSYLAGIQLFDSAEVSYQTIPMDAEGMVMDGLAVALNGAKLLYTLPNFQNPTGLTLSANRRVELARRVVEARVAIVEDDAYHDLRYDEEPLPTVSSLAKNPWAIYTGSFSKVIAPGIRVGYLCGSAEVVERLVCLKQITDLHTGSLTQRIVYEYCARGFLEPGIRRLRDVYRARRDVMLAALQEHCAGVVKWNRPQGGMFIFCTLPEERDATSLLQIARARGIVFVPGAGFHANGGGENTFRLNFVSADEERIRSGISTLGDAIREWLA
jgi:2-aminoadipate transaminase